MIVLPGAEAAVREGCLELAEYLHRRYPSVYSVIRRENNTDGWYGEGEIWKIMVDSSATVGGKTEVYDMDVDNPMAISGSLVQDEVIIMIEGDDGQVSHRDF